MSLIQRNEGRSFAMSMLESVAGISSAFFETDGFRTVLENLRESAKGKRHERDNREGQRTGWGGGVSNERMRTEFEAWANEEIGLTYRNTEPEYNDEYLDSHTQMAWMAWQASRAALLVELPAAQPGNFLYAPNVVEAIEAIGVRVKV